MTVYTTDRMRDQFPSFGIRHCAHFLKAFHDGFLAMSCIIRHTSFYAGLVICRDDGRMTMQTSSRLLELGDPFSLFLIFQHVGMATFFPIIHTKGIALEEDALAGILIELLKSFRASVFGAFDVDRAAIAVVLPGKISTPDGRIDSVLGHLRQLKDVLLRFLLAIRNVLQQQHDAKRDSRHENAEHHVSPCEPRLPDLCLRHQIPLSISKWTIE